MISEGLEKAKIATKFHNTIILTIFDSVSAIRFKTGINKVVFREVFFRTNTFWRKQLICYLKIILKFIFMLQYQQMMGELHWGN